jgi:hypothetical protein
VNPVHQKAKDDCLSACVASILEIDLDEVPNFVRPIEGDARDWLERLSDWLRSRGKGLLHIKYPNDDAAYPVGCWVILCGLTEEQGPHAVVGYTVTRGKKLVDGRYHVLWDYMTIHDPHLGGNGFEGKPDCVLYICEGGAPS